MAACIAQIHEEEKSKLEYTSLKRSHLKILINSQQNGWYHYEREKFPSMIPNDEFVLSDSDDS